MKVTNCRLCNSTNLTEWLDLGFSPHSDQFRRDKDTPELQYPLRVSVCNDCGLSQLSYVVEKEVMYTEDYLYEASITKTADKHWGDLADDVIERTGITSGLAVDVGGNDGTLSLKFKERGFQVINIDPCKEVTDISRERGVETITDFFCDRALKLLGEYATDEPDTFYPLQADIITGTNVFAHVHDLHTFMKDIKTLLKEDGVFVFESPYFGEFYNQLEYSTIYHQHLSYLSVKPLIRFLDKFGMEIFDIVFSELHGGAFRCYISRKGQHDVKPIVKESADKENWTIEDLNRFAKETREHGDKLFSIIYDYYRQGKKICCVSSPAKGMTQLNYINVNRFISFLTERSKLKIGRFTPGGHLPILSDEHLKDADVAVLLAWNFSTEIMANNKDWKGTWIIPNKEIEIV